MRHAHNALLPLLLFVACGPGGPGPNGEPPNIPGTDFWVDTGGVDRGAVAQLRPSATEVRIEQGLDTRISVEGVFSDGTAVPLNRAAARVGEGESAVAQVQWTVTPEGAVTLSEPTEAGVTVTGANPGEGALVARLGDLQAEVPLTVVPPALVGLELSVEQALEVRSVAAVIATARYRDGRTEDVTRRATWVSSDPAAIPVLDDAPRKGLVFPYLRGATTVTATYEDQTATLDLEVPCGMDPSNRIALNEAMPNASWPSAILYDVEKNRSERPLSIRDLMCDESFSGYRAFVFSLNAGWCGPCHAWMRTVAANEAALEEAGILPVFVIGDTTTRGDYASSNTAYADQLVTQHDSPFGFRVGDSETQGAGEQGVKQVLGVTQGWPSLFVVERDGMRVLSLSGGAPSNVNGIIQTVNQGGGPGPELPPSNCRDGDEEASEPNDVLRLAPEIGPGDWSGGICNVAPDMYRVKAEGRWRAVLSFQNRIADLDLYGWDETTDSVLRRDNRAVGSFSTRDDVETIEMEGESVIRVQSKRLGDTAPYTLTIEPI